MTPQNFVRAASLEEVKQRGCMAVQVNGHTLALFAHNEAVYAVDNRCPHMGFPLDKGTVHDGILTCHWHHARFDLASGGTFDQFADDVPAFPVEIRDGAVWVNLAPSIHPMQHQRKRLQDGLERNIPLVIAKAVNILLDGGDDPAESFRAGLKFGTTYRRNGWGQGLTILACMMNLLTYLHEEDYARAMYHGLSAVAADTDSMPPRFIISPLPTTDTDAATLKNWFRQFIEVRDDEGAERCIVSAIRAGADHQQVANMLFASATDHRYLQIGHVLDFTNKALEALDIAGWDCAEPVLTSLARMYAVADRMEESNAWRHPIDLIAILDKAFDTLENAIAEGQNRRGAWTELHALVEVLLGDDPQAIADSLLGALRAGCTELQLAQNVAYAAALRIARFHTSNEFGDWDTALHTFTFANAVYQGLKRVNSPELLRGVFDAAMSVYLDRFLNILAARLPHSDDKAETPDTLLDELPTLLNRQHQVNEVGMVVGQYFYSDGNPDALMAVLGRLLLREDRDFHTIQCVEAAFRQYELLRGQPEGVNVLVSAARYLAAHSPTMRAQGQTYQIAYRLSRGENLFEG